MGDFVLQQKQMANAIHIYTFDHGLCFFFIGLSRGALKIEILINCSESIWLIRTVLRFVEG